MKTVEKKYFVCETCGRTSQDESKIQECQANHHIITDDCLIEHTFNKGGPFPKELRVTFPDGAYARYTISSANRASEKPKEGGPENAHT